MNSYKKRKKVSVLLVGILLLIACGKTPKPIRMSETIETQPKFASQVTHEGTPLEGGILKYAIVASSPFKGVFMDELATDATDSVVTSQIDATLFEYDENRKLTNTGLASVTFDLENKTATIRLNSKDYKWSDGHSLTIDDYIFAIEAVGNPNYPGSRYNANYQNIEGMEAYHTGDQDHISGVEKQDDETVVLHFMQMRPSMRLAGGALPYYVMPKHIFSTIPMNQWLNSEYVRGNKGVGLGPFKIATIVPGESVTLIGNEHYYKGRAKVDKVLMEMASPDTIVSQMKAGQYDIAVLPSSQYEAYKDLTNVSLLSSFSTQYEYIAFHLGKYDGHSGKNIPDPQAKMSDPRLRQAMAYALDLEVVGNQLYHGLQRGTNSIVLPFFQDIYNEKQAGFTYQPQKAKQLLDEAGYADRDGDGFRENKDGSVLTLTFAARTRDQANEALVQQYIRWWAEIGLRVQLYTGKTIESNAFYNKMNADDPKIDLFAAGWSTGYDPNPANVFGETSKFNFSRFVTPKGNEILQKIGSLAAFDDDKNKAFYEEWQAYVHDEAFIIPTLVGDTITAVNKRVKYMDTSIATSQSKAALYQLELVADQPIQ